MNKKARKVVGIWLIIGLIMVFVQVLLGGITRLTDSGLSITEWKVVKGVLPPMNEQEWQIAFDKYKNMANQQYEHLHPNMTLPKFKKIFFWEWFHRLWARSMGFVFIFPLLLFLYKKYIPSWLLKRLSIVMLLAMIVASLGWLMVLSGFDDKQRTWVSAYKLSLHLGVAAWLFSYLFNTVLYVLRETVDDTNTKYRKYSHIIIGLLFLQILFGGLMAGMRAGIIHAHFPFFMGENSLLNIISSSTNFSFENIINYESNNYIKAIVQIFHRSFAWIILVVTLIFSYKILKKDISNYLKHSIYIVLIIIAIQFTLGAFTIVNSTNKEMLIILGVLHQAFAFISLLAWLNVGFCFRRKVLT